MRRPRDYDADLKVLEEKARALRSRKLVQLGELVVATGADRLEPELLAGLLLAAVETSDFVTKEEWRRCGAAFFQGKARPAAEAGGGAQRTQASRGGVATAAGEDRA